MYQNRNLRNADIVIATIVAILGGLAAAKHLPGQLTIPLGFGLFFAPGYLWSQAILSHRIPGFERAMTSAGMAFIFPIIGGFLFYGLHIPLKEPAWVGLLVVLTLLGVVAVAIQRLREEPEDPRLQQQRRNQQPRRNESFALHAGIYGLAGLIAIGAIGYSVKSAEAQKFPGYTALSMTQIINDSASQDTARLSNDQLAQDKAAREFNSAQPKATQARLEIINYEGVPEQYEVKLFRKGKLATTWKNITLNNGQSWHQTVAWSVSYSIVANLYKLPNVTKPYRMVKNGD